MNAAPNGCQVGLHLFSWVTYSAYEPSIERYIRCDCGRATYDTRALTFVAAAEVPSGTDEGGTQ